MISVTNKQFMRKVGKTPMNVQKKKTGFTIIEVVLVLAIAGLIFIMVFTALPALQQGQRDTDRKHDVAKVLAAIQSYQSNNRNAMPSANDAFAKYLDDTDNNGTVALTSGLTVTKSGTRGAQTVSGVSDTNIVFVAEAKCGTENTVTAGGARQAAVLVQLEQGDAYYCESN